MNEIAALTDADLTKRMVFLKALLDEVNVELAVAKEVAERRWAKGSTLPARDGFDMKLGYVNKSDPKPVARVTDRDTFESYVHAEYPDELRPAVTLGDTGEIVAILIDAGREDLVEQTVEIPASLVTRLEKAAMSTPVPGITVRRPEGVVSVTVATAARTSMKQLLADGLLAIEEGR